MKQYFGYIRVSTQKQGRGVSLDEQRTAIAALAERRGLKIVAWFVETETAAKQGRTEYTKMIRALTAGKAGGVIIHKIDRGARNLKDWANLGELIDSGVDVQFAHESLDMHSRGGRLAADIQAVVAADYIRNLRDEVLKGFYGRLKQGVYPLPAPIGYLDRGAGIPKDIDPINAPLVRFAFERYSAGDIGLIALQKELAARGFKTHRGTAPSFTALAKMLHNPFYMGLIRIQRRGEVFQGAHSPLISKELFDRVQMVMIGKHHPTATKHSFRYRGLIRHIGCTRRLTGEIAKGRFVYYRCHGLQCKGVVVSEPAMEKAVSEKLQSVACSPHDMRDLRDLVADERSKRSADTARDIASLKLRIVRCDDRLARLTDALLDGTISKEVFDQRNARLLGERRDLQDRLAGLDDEPVWLKLYREFELKNPQLLRFGSLLDSEKRELLSELCSDFGVEGKKPVIALRSPYKEIAETNGLNQSGPRRGDVRTKALALLEIFRRCASGNANDDTSTRQPEIAKDRPRSP